MNNKIHLAGQFRMVEHPANDGTILPGMLVELLSTSKVQKHSTAGGFAETAFAQEDALQGNTVATAYASGDPVRIFIEARGSLTNGLFLAGSNYTVGTKLISDGAGRLKPTTGSPSQIIAVVTEALNLSASGAVDALGKCRVL